MKKKVLCRMIAWLLASSMLLSIVPMTEVNASGTQECIEESEYEVRLSEQTYEHVKYVAENRYIINNGFGYGMVDFEGNELIECVYDGYTIVGPDEVEFYSSTTALVYNIHTAEYIFGYETWEAVEYCIFDEWAEGDRYYTISTGDRDGDEICDLYREYKNGLLCEAMYLLQTCDYSSGGIGGYSAWGFWKLTYINVETDTIVYSGMTGIAGPEESAFTHAFSCDLTEDTALVLDDEGNIVIVDPDNAYTYDEPSDVSGYWHWGSFGGDNWIRYFEMGYYALYNPITEELICKELDYCFDFYYGCDAWYAISDKDETDLYDIYYKDECIIDNCLGVLFYEDYIAYGNLDNDCVYMDYSGNELMITDQHANFVDGIAMVYYEDSFCLINESFEIICEDLPLDDYHPYNTGVVQDDERNLYLVQIVRNGFVIDEDGCLIEYNGNEEKVTVPDGVTSIGTDAFFMNYDVLEVVLSETVTSICEDAFAACFYLNEIYIPESVENIDPTAFEDVSEDFIIKGYENSYAQQFAEENNFVFVAVASDSITDENGFVISGDILVDYVGEERRITIPDGVTIIGQAAFRNCSDILQVTLPESVSIIEEYAFSCGYNYNNGRYLAQVDIPSSVTYIADNAFLNSYYCTIKTTMDAYAEAFAISKDMKYFCTGLGEADENGFVVVDDELVEYVGCDNIVIIPDGVVGISPYAFRNCVSVACVTIPDSVTWIGNDAFAFCDNLSEIDFPEDYSCLSSNTFEGCISLTTITIPESVNEIWNRAFASCINLKTINISEKVTYIGFEAFEYCTSLESMVIPDAVTTIGMYAFYCCTNLQNVKLPANLEHIATGTFRYCTSIKKIDIPETVESIDYAAFAYCTSLENIVIPGSVSTIGSFAFNDCKELQTVEIQDGVETIGQYAFDWCSSLDWVIIPESVTTIDETAFDNYYSENLIIYGHKGSYAETFAIENGFAFVELEDEIENPFTDVAESEYYYQPILWAYENNITTGLTETTFGTTTKCTRAQIVTFLWRAMGSPEPTTTVNPFTDVSDNDYYTKAVLWAYENRITTGLDATTFGTFKECTRAQIVTFLWRAMGEEDPTTTEHTFADVADNDYYTKAVLWAKENGITTGMSATKFGTSSTCIRADVVTFLYRALNNE